VERLVLAASNRLSGGRKHRVCRAETICPSSCFCGESNSASQPGLLGKVLSITPSFATRRCPVVVTHEIANQLTAPIFDWGELVDKDLPVQFFTDADRAGVSRDASVRFNP